ncbi:hypothetical protein II906_04815, partial [bacterium]|nr:hypothetical protein [bacterium]
IPKKDYGDLPLYHKKGIISEYMSKPSDYGDICHTYGCSDNGDANAKFVRTQVLSKQGDKAAAGIGIKAKDHAEIMRDLFIANFNNPKLKKADTLTLLNKAKSVLAPEEYTKYVGLLHDAI